MTPRARGSRSRGATMIEFVLVGIPMMFMLICIFEISRGMWVYSTEAFAVKEGVRFAIVHGTDCVGPPQNPNNPNTNYCPATVGDVAWVIWQAGVGLDLATTKVVFTAADGSVITCATLTACLTNANNWPPQTTVGNAVGEPVRIDISTPFYSALGMFWPGSKGALFAPVTFGASSTDYIQF